MDRDRRIREQYRFSKSPFCEQKFLGEIEGSYLTQTLATRLPFALLLDI